jgi:hypothetical protein
MMILQTVLVIQKSTGQPARVNVKDFDPAQHERVELDDVQQAEADKGIASGFPGPSEAASVSVSRAPVPDVPPAESPSDPEPEAAPYGVSDALKLVSGATSAEDLDAVAAYETASEKPRKTVLRAVEAKRQALQKAEAAE